MNSRLSWPVLIAITAVITGTAALMARNVIYTEGEVMQSLYWFATVVTALMITLGFANRNLAAWLIVLCGGSLIVWQASQQRRWSILQEEVVDIVRHVNHIKQKTGSYPETLGGYTFRSPELKSQVGYSFHEGKIYIGYHLNDSGISYWYDQDTGFGYYPD